MTRDDVIRIFNLKDNADILDLPDGSFVSIDFFVNLFKSARELTCEELCKIDGGRYGYIEFFKQWKEEGLIG